MVIDNVFGINRKQHDDHTGTSVLARGVLAISRQVARFWCGMHGLSAARSNCRKVVKEGKQTTVCPAMFATDAYYERIAKLEIELRESEEELAEAEQAWRRGVD